MTAPSETTITSGRKPGDAFKIPEVSNISEEGRTYDEMDLKTLNLKANFLWHSAGFLDGLLSMSYEKFILDADLCGALHSYMAGVVVDDDTLAMDAFREVGPGSHFLGCAHTMRHYQSAFWDSQTADNEPWETWSENGGTDAMTRANRRWKQVLADYEAPPMDEATREALEDFVARRKASMEDAWH